MKKTKEKSIFLTLLLWLALAVCLILVVSLARRRLRKSDRPGSDLTFMRYEGPVFPLTLMEEDILLSAERSLTYDFSSFIEPGLNNLSLDLRDEYLVKRNG